MSETVSDRPRTSFSVESMIPMLILGTILQFAMVIGGHYNEFIRNNLFAVGGMLISMLAGALWARSHARGKGQAAGGGAIIGGGCALIGIIVSVLLGDTEAMILAIGTISSMVTGAIGGVILYAAAGVHRS